MSALIRLQFIEKAASLALTPLSCPPCKPLDTAVTVSDAASVLANLTSMKALMRLQCSKKARSFGLTLLFCPPRFLSSSQATLLGLSKDALQSSSILGSQKRAPCQEERVTIACTSCYEGQAALSTAVA